MRKRSNCSIGFIHVPGDLKHIRCLVCTEYSGKPYDLLQKHRKDHLKRVKHLAAVEWQKSHVYMPEQGCSTSNEDEVSGSGQTATLTFAPLHEAPTKVPSLSDTVSRGYPWLSNLPNVNEDEGLYRDPEGEIIHFTAGEDREHTFEQNIRQRIEDLSWFSHQSLGGFCDTTADVEGMSRDEDTTISNVAAVMQGLGKRISMPRKLIACAYQTQKALKMKMAMTMTRACLRHSGRRDMMGRNGHLMRAKLYVEIYIKH